MAIIFNEIWQKDSINKNWNIIGPFPSGANPLTALPNVAYKGFFDQAAVGCGNTNALSCANVFLVKYFNKFIRQGTFRAQFAAKQNVAENHQILLWTLAQNYYATVHMGQPAHPSAINANGVNSFQGCNGCGGGFIEYFTAPALPIYAGDVFDASIHYDCLPRRPAFMASLWWEPNTGILRLFHGDGAFTDILGITYFQSASGSLIADRKFHDIQILIQLRENLGPLLVGGPVPMVIGIIQIYVDGRLVINTVNSSNPTYPYILLVRNEVGIRDCISPHFFRGYSVGTEGYFNEFSISGYDGATGFGGNITTAWDNIEVDDTVAYVARTCNSNLLKCPTPPITTECCLNEDIAVTILINGVPKVTVNPLGVDFELMKLFEALKNDVITIEVKQTTGKPMQIIPSVDMHRVTYVTHDKDVGRN